MKKTLFCTKILNKAKTKKLFEEHNISINEEQLKLYSDFFFEAVYEPTATIGRPLGAMETMDLFMNHHKPEYNNNGEIKPENASHNDKPTENNFGHILKKVFDKQIKNKDYVGARETVFKFSALKNAKDTKLKGSTIVKGESVNSINILPKAGAGQEGTDELLDTYLKGTPGQSRKLMTFKSYCQNK